VNKKTVLVLLPAYDSSRPAFISQSDRYNVRTVIPADLSSPGWYYDNRAENNSRCAVGPQILVESEIAGVITRLPQVTADQLPHIIAADRSYLASEMTAFLLAWLSSLSCSVVNRPTATCLSGPYWRPEQWVHFAAKVGLPVVEQVKRVKPGERSHSAPVEGTARVMLIGDRCVGEVHPRLGRYAGKLARACGVAFLAVDFTHPGRDARFCGADLWPTVTPPMAGLMLDFVTGRSGDASRVRKSAGS
jgi:hypothetical protein